jgi:hypothetical protein
LAFAFAIALYVLNLGYGFERSLTPLGDFQFRSSWLSGRNLESDSSDLTGNRFSKSGLGGIPVPLPANYLLGIDHLKWEFERGYASYLRGEWRHGGWWYYYLYAILVKVPLGILVLGATTALATIANTMRGRMSGKDLFDEFVLLLPALAVVVLVSSQTGFNHHLRYVLPAFPFFFAWVGKLGNWFDRQTPVVSTGRSVVRHELTEDVGGGQHRFRNWVEIPRSLLLKRAFVVAMLGWAVVSSLSVYPNSHSYFNELVGGPESGWKYLHNSNVDWGQDLTYLKWWLDERPEISQIGVAPFPWVRPRKLGFNSFEPNLWPVRDSQQELAEDQVGPQPGWFAISVCHLVGEPGGSYPNKTSADYHLDPSRSYFRHFDPVDRIGHSMNMYHISLDECNELRRKLGLAQLPVDWKREESNAEFGVQNAE